ncbi:DUF3263 domain-containing protein [Streptomyces sp. PTM05]|uniref:DUF3263 domain-containing protein n=1 Tax=Streptantibioticus parmotrematis TaxID=2873249 RepID=A0ABS7QP40_9ACTN|nr:DUF3263 domain-containing protein [Streptantibioticus parmotrematis]MBY8884945.1 DUF3263 domain-containing protein [Streptantibioticus parmotrematis]
MENAESGPPPTEDDPQAAGLEAAAAGTDAEPEAAGAEAVEGDAAAAEVEAGADDAGLSARDVALLDLEGRQWRGQGAKERAIRERLGLSSTRYYQLLNALLDDPRAQRHAPALVNRLRRTRQARRERQG